MIDNYLDYAENIDLLPEKKEQVVKKNDNDVDLDSDEEYKVDNYDG